MNANEIGFSKGFLREHNAHVYTVSAAAYPGYGALTGKGLQSPQPILKERRQPTWRKHRQRETLGEANRPIRQRRE